jgi:hypothetical protein
MLEAEQNLRDKLLEFATSTRYDGEVQRAFDVYWSGRYTLDASPELDDIDHARFLEFYLFGYRFAEHDATAVELFDEFRAYLLDDAEQKLLAEWRHTIFGVFHRGETTGEGTRLRDMFDETDLTVVNPELAELPENCILIGRIIPVLGTYRLSGPVATLSDATVDTLREFVDARFEMYLRVAPGATWREFFRTEQHGLQHLLLDMRLKATAPQQEVRGVN